MLMVRVKGFRSVRMRSKMKTSVVDSSVSVVACS
jgi:hypothetical protein